MRLTLKSRLNVNVPVVSNDRDMVNKSANGDMSFPWEMLLSRLAAGDSDTWGDEAVSFVQGRLNADNLAREFDL